MWVRGQRVWDLTMPIGAGRAVVLWRGGIVRPRLLLALVGKCGITARTACSRGMYRALLLALAVVSGCGGEESSASATGGAPADGGGGDGATKDGSAAAAGVGGVAGTGGGGGMGDGAPADGAADGSGGVDSGWKGPPSCASQKAGAGMNCGVTSADCCDSPPVPGGSFYRINNAKYPATVSSFSLDRYEVTVGRMRAFVAVYPSNRPKKGDGAHPLIPGSGWDTAWDAVLPPTEAKLREFLICEPLGGEPPEPWKSWTDLPGASENKPVNCVDWYLAFAFCAWDGGRLPTEAEWNYAAAGGDEQRQYPWGSGIDASYASYDCIGDGFAGDCAFSDLLNVGSKPKGDSRWGHADLAGNVWEWVLDWHVTWAETACTDCAVVEAGNSNQRGLRGGGAWDGPQQAWTTSRHSMFPTDVQRTAGFRCAR